MAKNDENGPCRKKIRGIKIATAKMMIIHCTESVMTTARRPPSTV